jgi:hypothetical protein
MRLCENNQIAIGFVPVNLATAANNGDYVSLKGYKHVTVLFIKGAGASGEDPTLTLQQASSVAGAGAKELYFTTIYVKQGSDLESIGTFTKTTQSSANTYTSATSGEAQAIWAVEFDADELDVDNGFDCIRATVADVGDTSQIGTIVYILSEPRYAAETMPSAIAD